MTKRDLAMMALGAILSTLLLGAATSKPTKAPARQDRYARLDTLATVLSHVENSYVDRVPGNKLIYGAIKGMMGSLDPYSQFMPPRLYRDIKADTSGEHGGIGAAISRRDGKLIVIAPLTGGPAARAGVHPGDWIVRIGRALTRKMTLVAATRALRGRPGTKVEIDIHRGKWKNARRLLIVREQIRTTSVVGRLLPGGLAYARISSFQDRTSRHLRGFLEKMAGKNKGPLKGLVLDLRGNPGGLFDQAVRVADLFIKKGLIVTTKGRRGRRVEREVAHPRKTMATLPLIVLVDRGTASASEIVAGALKDHGRALLVGSRTYGKGSVQTIIDLADGSGLKLTVARYFTPSGAVIQERGIAPDLPMTAASARGSGARRDRPLDRATSILRTPGELMRLLKRAARR